MRVGLPKSSHQSRHGEKHPQDLIVIFFRTLHSGTANPRAGFLGSCHVVRHFPRLKSSMMYTEYHVGSQNCSLLRNYFHVDVDSSTTLQEEL